MMYLNESALRSCVGLDVIILRDASPGGRRLAPLLGNLCEVTRFDDGYVPLGGIVITERGTSAVDLSCVVSIRVQGTEIEAPTPSPEA